ncbi:MAG: efflux RND transporter periplasmic adaptor subunit [Cytophagales bacterium]|uniref:Efflux RND transporter periplasmic adaptor subunit n=1 Tax=Algoriphagus taiwanensis TaxID=1445656 RepID=A0ABQ6Q2K3_9BACT|nr:MAG: efflux RND transporter periplasmic adaptor subunit [Cytophagales bacterium]GMQ33713.1 efflux RND transporter periplasmic adaptor subunit [Algoriphagus taiwanensis]
MKKKPIFILLALVAFSCSKTTEPISQAPPEVKVTPVVSQEVKLEKDFVAQIYGKMDIPIRARTEGFLEGIHFQEGRMVRKGDLLYTVDPDPLKENVNTAMSQLAEAKVSLTQAENDLARYEPLAEINAISKKDLDAAVSRKKSAEAMVEAAQSRVNFQNIQLGYTSIKSPISGLIGKTNAKVGEFVGRDPNPVILNTVSIIDSVRVEFFLSENDYLDLFRDYQEHHNKEQRAQALRLILADGSVFNHEGYVDFVNRQIDTNTGTILIQATFPNPESLIRPGQFARVRAAISTVPDGILVPQRAVNEFQGRFFVFLVGEGNKLTQREVKLTGPYRDYFLIESGVSPGDKIVLEGLQKVAEGLVIQPVEVKFESQFQD